jgi:hypothetical protein
MPLQGICISGCLHLTTETANAILANSCQFDCEINIAALEEMKTSKREVRSGVVQYFFPDGYEFCQSSLVCRVPSQTKTDSTQHPLLKALVSMQKLILGIFSAGSLLCIS